MVRVMTKRNGDFSYSDGVSLKEYFDNRFEQNEKEVRLAADALNIRLEHLNEFRAQLRDQNDTFMTRAEYEGKHEALAVKIDGISKLVYMAVGACALVEIIIGIVIVLIKKG